MTCATACPCGRHGFRWTDRTFVLLAGGGPVVVDAEQIPQTCRDALRPPADPVIELETKSSGAKK